jgi:Methyltransferase domain
MLNVKNFARVAAEAVKLRHPHQKPSGPFELSADEIAALKASSPTELHRAFFAKSKRPAHKWRQYLEVYDRHLSIYRDRSLFFLEIGVMDGGSLEMWRRYFGPTATIVGIDIDPECANRVDPPNHVRIGSQDDPKFLAKVLAEFGPPDVVLDDGSHIARHQRASFEILFPKLTDDGLYVIEDMHTAYWGGEYEGGYRRKGTAIELVKQMIDDMHAWYHSKPTTTPAREFIDGIHVYDSITVIQKRKKSRPGFLEGGQG